VPWAEAGSSGKAGEAAEPIANKLQGEATFGFITRRSLNAMRRRVSVAKEASIAAAYCVSNLYVTTRATKLAKISRTGRDFRIIGLIEGRAADRAA
jgi:hypothetical protein